LVLLAVVLIIGLVTTALLGFFPGLSGDISENEARLYWQSVARPFRITEVSGSNQAATLCGQGVPGQPSAAYNLVLENADPDTMTLTAISGANAFCLLGGSASAGSIAFSGGERKVITALGFPACTAGRTVTQPMAFTYSTQYLSGKVQNGTKPLVFKCT
jgi:type II secretory pathway pseudopilin PulG